MIDHGVATFDFDRQALERATEHPAVAEVKELGPVPQPLICVIS